MKLPRVQAQARGNLVKKQFISWEKTDHAKKEWLYCELPGGVGLETK